MSDIPTSEISRIVNKPQRDQQKLTYLTNHLASSNLISTQEIIIFYTRNKKITNFWFYIRAYFKAYRKSGTTVYNLI